MCAVGSNLLSIHENETATSADGIDENPAGDSTAQGANNDVGASRNRVGKEARGSNGTTRTDSRKARDKTRRRNVPTSADGAALALIVEILADGAGGRSDVFPRAEQRSRRR